MDVATLIKQQEGLRLKAYKDTVGKTTIGYGRNLDDLGISQAEADELFTNDLNRVTAAVSVAIPFYKTLNEPRQAVLVSMAFNMGLGGLLGFRNFLLDVKNGSWAQAAGEMLNSRWATQVGSRATDLSNMMLRGAWL